MPVISPSTILLGELCDAFPTLITDIKMQVHGQPLITAPRQRPHTLTRHHPHRDLYKTPHSTSHRLNPQVQKSLLMHLTIFQYLGGTTTATAMTITARVVHLTKMNKPLKRLFQRLPFINRVSFIIDAKQVTNELTEKVSAEPRTRGWLITSVTRAT